MKHKHSFKFTIKFEILASDEYQANQFSKVLWKDFEKIGYAKNATLTQIKTPPSDFLCGK